jgi:hypothetical protein
MNLQRIIQPWPCSLLQSHGNRAMMNGIGAAMTTQYYTGPNYGGRFFSFLLALALGAAGFAVFVRHATTGPAARIVALVTGRATGMDASAPAVVEKLHRLGRLQTVVYSQDTVVEGNFSQPTPYDAPRGGPMLLVIHGESIAGIDLAQLKPEDVRIDAGGQGIHITLPASQLFSTTLDNRPTRVYSHMAGTLVPVDQSLAPDTRARAQDQLQQTALTDGILNAASKNARTMVTGQVNALGFQQVEVQ